MKLRTLWMVAVVAGASGVGTACMDKVDPDKGVLEDEPPPGSEPAPQEGKGDASGVVVQVAVETAHPYANNLDKPYVIALDGRVPSCANSARVHFASLRTEPGYDFVYLEGAGGRVQTFDGDKTDLWSSFAPLTTGKTLTVRLTTDYSVTRDGFRIDAVEATGHVICPAIAYPACPAGQIDINASRGMCECQITPTCVPEGTIELEHAIGGGFTGQVTGHRAVGTAAYAVTYRPGQPDQVVAIGTIDRSQLTGVVRAVEDAHLLSRPAVTESSNWNETLAVAIGAASRSFTRAAGTFPTADAELISQVDGLFTCGGDGALTCGAGYQCQAGVCTATQGCVCPAVYQPVCGVDGHTYSNSCEITCAGATRAHDGACGQIGDPCGGILGRTCQDGNRCRYGASQYQPPFPDAGGSCVAGTYCDAAADCSGQAHTAVLGNWTCEQHTCAWRAGNPWHVVTGFAFATAHPYGNRASQWMKLDAPAGAAKVRLVVHGTFELERGYDYLEVYVKSGTSWRLARRYTGTTAPALTDEFAGRELWLRLASDVSITKYGFDVGADWSN